MKLLNNINKFYQEYCDPIVLTKRDMHNHNTLMSVCKDIQAVMECHNKIDKDYQWLSSLYDTLDDYIAMSHRYNAVAIFKAIVSIFGILGIGVFATVIIKFSYIDFIISSGLIVSIILAVCGGIGAYEEVR